jgi:hypothetical protein
MRFTDATIAQMRRGESQSERAGSIIYSEADGSIDELLGCDVEGSTILLTNEESKIVAKDHSISES